VPRYAEQLGLSFPVSDPQFWIVTAVFALALGWMLRGLLGLRKAGRGRTKSTRVSLTVGGKVPNDGKVGGKVGGRVEPQPGESGARASSRDNAGDRT
jgi:hypothetical protein